MNQEFYNFLFNYWVDNVDNLCDYCKNDIKCKGKDCPKYDSWYPERVELDGKVISKEEQPWAYKEYSCLDLDYGECDLLIDTPCHGCSYKLNNNFEWNGIVPN